jgi:hypothetical protein
MTVIIEKPSVTPIFARHETFHPRYGWLKKGFDKATLESKIFAKENAPTILGVGKNMVSAIKYWCYSFKVLEEVMSSDKKTRFSNPTFIGDKLLSETGYDPYLEDLATLWLLHWNLLKPDCLATSWYFVFNEYKKLEFTADELLNELKDFKEKEFPNNKVVDGSLIKDLHCLVRMYVEQKINKNAIEETIDCPFVELNLIQTTDNKHFYFNVGEKAGLAPEIIVACCLEFAAMYDKNIKTISLARLLYEKNSPGLIFKLSENFLYSSIEKVAEKFKEITLSDTAGLIQFSFKGDPLMLANKIIEHYYGGRK